MMGGCFGMGGYWNPLKKKEGSSQHKCAQTNDKCFTSVCIITVLCSTLYMYAAVH